MITSKDFDPCKMNLHDVAVFIIKESKESDGWEDVHCRVLRVPKGWIYTYANYNQGFIPPPIFVPEI